MMLIMTGLDHKKAELDVREKFALTKERTGRTLASIKSRENIGGFVIISTCNRTELYASVSDGGIFEPTRTLCETLDKNVSDYGRYFTEKTGGRAMEHLCRVASGLDSQITGDDQIITQVREALEFSRGHNCTDGYIETMFGTAIKAAKTIKTNVILKTFGTGSVPEKAVEKLKGICVLAGRSAVVIGNGQMGRLTSELLIREGVNVTVTLREYKKGIIQVTDRADTVSYGERYKAVEKADIVVSATASPHFTLCLNDLKKLGRLPEIFVDLAVPRDIEPSVGEIPGLTLLTIDDISGESRVPPPESMLKIDEIIAGHIDKYNRWLTFKNNIGTVTVGGAAGGRKQPAAFFPLFVDMRDKKTLVIGGGRIAERRIKVLSSFGADITVISPDVTEHIRIAASRSSLRLIERKYQNGDVADLRPFLVIAAAGDRLANREAMEEATSLNVPVSVADCREECSFYFPAIAENENYVAGLVSKNGDHAGVRQMAEKIRGLLNI